MTLTMIAKMTVKNMRIGDNKKVCLEKSLLGQLITILMPMMSIGARERSRGRGGEIEQRKNLR